MPPICYNGDMIKCICAPTQDDALLALARCAEENEARGERTLVFCEDALTLLAERAVLRARKATFLTEVTTFARYLSGAGRAISKQGSVAAVSAILSESASLACFSANAAEAVSQKYMRHKPPTRENFAKAYRHLISRGFGYDEAKEAVAALRDGAEEGGAEEGEGESGGEEGGE